MLSQYQMLRRSLLGVFVLLATACPSTKVEQHTTSIQSQCDDPKSGIEYCCCDPKDGSTQIKPLGDVGECCSACGSPVGSCLTKDFQTYCYGKASNWDDVNSEASTLTCNQFTPSITVFCSTSSDCDQEYDCTNGICRFSQDKNACCQLNDGSYCGVVKAAACRVQNSVNVTQSIAPNSDQCHYALPCISYDTELSPGKSCSSSSSDANWCGACPYNPTTGTAIANPIPGSSITRYCPSLTCADMSGTC